MPQPSKKNGFKIGVIGLNTAFLQLKEGDFKGKLDVDAGQIVQLCGMTHQDWINEHNICFLMTHHPENWLSANGLDQMAVIAPPGRFLLHLCGHQHETNRTDFAVGGSPYYKRVMQASSIFGMEKYDIWNGDGSKKEALDRRHGYCVGKVEFNDNGANVKLWPRSGFRRVNGRFVFARDNEQEIETDGGPPPFMV